MSIKAIALISGGLDSLLAAKVVQAQDIDVLGVAFVMAPASTDIDRTAEEIKEISEKAGVPVKVADISEDFVEMMKDPPHGFGSEMNPCIDCKIMMMRKVKAMMEAEEARFVVTGEVLGERPMSQNRQSLQLIQKVSGLGDVLLRPLSAKLLDETAPEKEGLVDRGRLHDIQGRSRKPQLALAKKYGIKKYSPPGVSCLLTDPGFSARIKDLARHEGLSVENIELIKIGRQFRLDEKTRAIVGRNEQENEKLCEAQSGDDLLFRFSEDLPGPDVLLRGKGDDENIKKAASFVVSYSKYRDKPSMEIAYWRDGGEERTMVVPPLPEEEIEEYRI
ncbi:MAG: DUF814 domain-containing protein [Candidatus Omnitrophica bacterium]|nr:DUF814 domain-containing protein [Candidatus Omnitrophota bacterium]